VVLFFLTFTFFWYFVLHCFSVLYIFKVLIVDLLLSGSFNVIKACFC